MTRAGLLLLGSVALIGARPHDPFAGRVAGKSVECVHLNQSDGLVIADATTITYRDGTRLWRTTPVGQCAPLHIFDKLAIDSFAGQVCRGDVFRVLPPESAVPIGSCQFGPFTPYTAAGH